MPSDKMKVAPGQKKLGTTALNTFSKHCSGSVNNSITRADLIFCISTSESRRLIGPLPHHLLFPLTVLWSVYSSWHSWKGHRWRNPNFQTKFLPWFEPPSSQLTVKPPSYSNTIHLHQYLYGTTE